MQEARCVPLRHNGQVDLLCSMIHGKYVDAVKKGVDDR